MITPVTFEWELPASPLPLGLLLSCSASSVAYYKKLVFLSLSKLRSLVDVCLCAQNILLSMFFQQSKDFFFAGGRGGGGGGREIVIKCGLHKLKEFVLQVRLWLTTKCMLTKTSKATMAFLLN